MKPRNVIVIMSFVLLMLWNCDVTESNETDSAAMSILATIELDDSTYAIDGWEDIEDTDFSLSKAAPGLTEGSQEEILVRDSSSIWRFGRRNMSQEREVTIETEDDSSAIVLISHHITGSFHARQFERVWTSDSTWERGDSIRFSTKPIDLTMERRVAVRKITADDGSEHWRPMSKTLAYGTSSTSLDVSSFEWIARDSIRVLEDFSSTFYDRNDPLVFVIAGNNRVNALVSNDIPGDAELVRARWGYHPHLNGPDLRLKTNLHYVETNENLKVYTRRLEVPNRPNRMFRGSLKVVDDRSLYDHDYPTYDTANLAFTYFVRRASFD